jgi:hypothetical protein
VVIDACVGCSAGLGVADSLACREFLQVVFKAGIVFHASGDVMSEWSKHAGSFGVSWLAQMASAGRLQMLPMALTGSRVRIRVEMLGTSSTCREASSMIKDLHLIEAALTADGRVASRDEASRSLFQRAAGFVHELTSIYWANPTILSDDASDWVLAGCPARADLRLG